jgi:hypothetical protein
MQNEIAMLSGQVNEFLGKVQSGKFKNGNRLRE